MPIERGVQRWLIAALLGAAASAVSCGPRDEDTGPDANNAPKADPKPESENLFDGKLKPYLEVNRMVNERLLAGPTSLSLSDYFQDPPEKDDIFAIFTPSLKDLLGGYNGDGLRNELQNAAPNGVNMLLWYMAFDGLASELTQACVANGEAKKFDLVDLRDDMSGLVKTLCQEVDTHAVTEPTLQALWQLVMRSDAPATEFDSWRAFIMGDSLAGQEGHAVAHAAVMAMLYNPHFLLQK